MLLQTRRNPVRRNLGYYFMVIKTMFMEEAVVQPQLPPRPLAIALGVMVVATVLLGLFPAVVLNAVTESVKLLQ